MTETMKMFKKGQVVIPVKFRKLMKLEADCLVDIEFDEKEQTLKIRLHETQNHLGLAGCFSEKVAKKFPSHQEMNNALAKGLKPR